MTSERQIILGVDQGTTNTKVVALDRTGTMQAMAARPVATRAPRPGWVEQNAEAMFDNVVACIREVLEKTGRSARDAVGLGISNQTETLIIWDKQTGAPAMPAIVWQCRRGAEQAARLRKDGAAEFVKSRTGLDLDPTFTALKLLWVMENAPNIRRGLEAGTLIFGTVDTWLIWRLTGGSVYATEPSNASRTMLFDLESLAWSSPLIERFGLSLPLMPSCRRSSEGFGATDAKLFGAEIPITSALGDQQASLFGHRCFDRGQSKISYGTGAFVWVNAGTTVPPDRGGGLVRTLAWQIEEPCYALEGFVMQAGAALEWVAKTLGVGEGSADAIRVAEEAKTSAGVILVPAFQGFATPWWVSEVRAAFLGMSSATMKAHLAHSALEAVCYQVRAVLDAVADAIDEPLRLIKVDGGLTRSPYLMQLQANVIGAPLLPAASEPMTPVGSAMLAGLGSGFWNSLSDLKALVGEGTAIEADPASKTLWDSGYLEWLRAVETTIAFHAASDTCPAASEIPESK